MGGAKITSIFVLKNPFQVRIMCQLIGNLSLEFLFSIGIVLNSTRLKILDFLNFRTPIKISPSDINIMYKITCNIITKDVIKYYKIVKMVKI